MLLQFFVKCFIVPAVDTESLYKLIIITNAVFESSRTPPPRFGRAVGLMLDKQQSAGFSGVPGFTKFGLTLAANNWMRNTGKTWRFRCLPSS
jgi:hypothetical protein